MNFKVIGEISDVQTIAVGAAIRSYADCVAHTVAVVGES
jgi:hypothetical protein